MPETPVADVVAVACAQWRDPAVVFDALWAGRTDVFWLDGGIDADTGWSFAGAGDRVADTSDVHATRVGGRGAVGPAGPFTGGWIGWCGYEAGAARAGAPVADGDAAPGEAWLRAREWVAFDHTTHTMWALAGARAAAEELAARAGAAVRPEVRAAHDALPPVVARARHTPTEYADLIARCHDAIRAGDAYQLCLTTRFEVDGAIDPDAVYRRLRAGSRSHHGAFVRIGDTSVLSATPEQFLVVADGIVRTKPIKGTRPRGAEPVEDARLAEEMLQSAKERAENVMIVDLMRNDLAQVSAVGTVRVDALLEVESYPHVHQLVSTVSGHLRSEVTLAELLRRAFPAGSMTGAPKLSAMTILHALEGGPRGVYAGCIGWVGTDGALDLAMVIRTIVVTPTSASVGAGGGITWSSVIADEVAEVGVKARAPLAALGAVLPAGW